MYGDGRRFLFPNTHTRQGYESETLRNYRPQGQFPICNSPAFTQQCLHSFRRLQAHLGIVDLKAGQNLSIGSP